MADDLSKRGPADAKRISLTEDWERRYWCGKFGCSLAELQNAVRSAGHMAEDVGSFLKGDEA